MGTYIPIFIILIVIFVLLRQKRLAVVKRIVKNRKKEDKTEMIELAKRFIGKECLIYAFDGGHQFEGIIKEVSESAVLLEKDGQIEAINLDFVIRIREFPRNKKGKKKSVVLDWQGFFCIKNSKVSFGVDQSRKKEYYTFILFNNIGG